MLTQCHSKLTDCLFRRTPATAFHFLKTLGLSAFCFLLIPTSSWATKVFVYCSEGSPGSFNPQQNMDPPSFNASSLPVFNRLIDFKQDSTELRPSLAESWTISEDGLKYTFQLRKNVAFHSNFGFKPSRHFNADDVLFSFARQGDSKHPYHNIGQGQYPFYKSMDMASIIQEIRKVDSHQVEFLLKKKEAPFLANLAMDFASIHSAEYAEFLLKNKKPELIDQQPIGTGPFAFESYQKDLLIRYRAFAEHWNGKPKIDELVIAITTDPSVRSQKLIAGECHHISEPAPADLETLRKAKNVIVHELEGLNVGYLAMNTEKKPFDNRLVRQAVLHALNREHYVKSIFLGTGTVAKNPIPPNLWSYDNSTKPIAFDLKKAKGLLKQAGYPKGFETEMWFMSVSRPYNPAGKKLAELMQADLAKIGIKLKLITYDWPTYMQKGRRGEHTTAQFGFYSDNGDPDNFFNVLLSCNAVAGGGNRARWCNKEFDDLILRAKETTDQGLRTELYKKAQQIFAEEVPWALLAHGKLFRAVRSNVTGYVPHPLAREDFSQVDFKD